MRLWLVRHAATTAPPDVCIGRTDVPASDDATAQAARRLHAALPARLAWRVSPSVRARQLAQGLQALRPHLRAPVVDARLAELDFGAWEGQRWDAVPRAELDAWAAAFADHRPGGGESVRALLRRVRAALHTVVDDAPALDQVWITHAGVIRAVLHTLAAGWGAVPTAASAWPQTPVRCGQWVAVPLAALRADRDFP
ncbi:MAG: histidine phosphatase family protein [Pseudomonadota bacterium]